MTERVAAGVPLPDRQTHFGVGRKSIRVTSAIITSHFVTLSLLRSPRHSVTNRLESHPL